MSLFEDALAYARKGWRVLPIGAGTKSPIVKRWQDLATTDEEQITQWWANNPDAGIGLATGAASGFFVLDVDPAKGGGESLRALEAAHERISCSAVVRSGSGGIHMYFAFPDWELRNNQNRLGNGLDIRAEGGQVLAPPTLHPNGTPYEWLAPPVLAPAPDWLLGLLRGPSVAVPSPLAPAAPQQYPAGVGGEGERPGDRWAAEVSWAQLLETDGATRLASRRESGYVYDLWVRPGKDAREGPSASVGYGGSDLLVVHSTNWPRCPAGTYTKFGYLAETRFNGSHSAAAESLAEHYRRSHVDAIIASTGMSAVAPVAPAEIGIETTPSGAPPAPASDLLKWAISWPELWEIESTREEWLVEPLLAAGRAHSLYAPGKTGKSLLVLEMCLALATGRPFLRRPEQPPIPVIYIDWEMTLADIRERLESFGFGPTDDLSMFHYVLMPGIRGLDTEEGGKAVVEAVDQIGPALVVIDTTARAVEGPENEADTVRAFYRYTGMALKSRGVAYLRVDHAGKNLESGQRGSSAKNDDVDIVWQLTAAGNSLQMKATHRRVPWVPELVNLNRDEDDDGRTHHTIPVDKLPPIIKDIILRLDSAGAPVDISQRMARDLLKTMLVPARTDNLREALRVRRQLDLVGWAEEAAS